MIWTVHFFWSNALRGFEIYSDSDTRSVSAWRDCGLSLITLREFRSRLDGLATGVAGEYALVCIGRHRSVNDLPLTIVLEALAEANTVMRLHPCLVSVLRDDLVCFLPDCSRINALRFARLLRAAVQASAPREGRLLLGIGVVPVGEARRSTQLLRFAHNACREAMRRGHNHIEVYEPT